MKSKLTVGMIIFATQSNEQGAAAYEGNGLARTIKFQSMYGYPVNDLDGNGARNASAWRGTTWTPLAERLSRELDVRCQVLNSCVGGTSFVDHWVGMCTTWAPNSSNFGILTNTWVIPTSGGNRKYKYTTAGAHGTTEPTYNTTIGGTTTDGAAVLTAYAADANDTNGHIYVPGESGFDPAGYTATAIARMNSLSAEYDKLIVIIAGGQADLAGRPKSAQQVSTARQILTNHILNNNSRAIVFNGVSFYWNTGFEGSPNFRSYDVVSQPACDLANAALKSNPRCKEGASLFKSLGKSIDFVTGESDAVHSGPNSILASPEPWVVSLAQSGALHA